ncbi:MAG TPA: signal recognition particle-docking protein FtsY [Clostridiaceae bacterium]|nr:signal recognition particle-docking protein FtsY [Clostridiaceae bacterium]
MSLFDRFKNGLTKTRDFMTASFNRMAAGFGVFDDDMLDELEMTLIQADCGIAASTEAVEAIREHIRRTGDASREGVLRVLHESLASMLHEKKLEVEKDQLTIYLMVGVNGTGKTTTSAKLAQRAKKEGRRVMMAAADTFRAAAVEQLKVWGERTQTAVIAHETGSDPAAVVFDAIGAAKARHTELLLVDTAGRLHTKKNLMEELAKIRRVIDREAPDAHVETLLVIDATTGQNAIIQARAFHEATRVTGIALTKLDGSAKGGVAVAMARETGLPLCLAGLGEGADDLSDFDRDLFLQALLPEA